MLKRKLEILKSRLRRVSTSVCGTIGRVVSPDPTPVGPSPCLQLFKAILHVCPQRLTEDGHDLGKIFFCVSSFGEMIPLHRTSQMQLNATEFEFRRLLRETKIFF